MLFTRYEQMLDRGYARSARLAKACKADTMYYGTLSLRQRLTVINDINSLYIETDHEYEVDIYLFKGEYVAVDEYDRTIY